MDDGGIFDAILIDFRKAFDVVPHDRLVHKLSALDVCDKTLHRVANFLSGHTQSTRVNSSCFSSFYVSSGVIQDSAFGPLLFALYINDLPSVCVDCIVKLYADDVKEYKGICSSADRIVLQSALNAI